MGRKNMLRQALWGLLVLLAACAPTISQTPAPTPADATSISGTYQGRYVCSQGVTGLTLTLEGTAEGNVVARFDFYAVPENPSVPSGSYLLSGIFFSDSSLHLDPVRWIRQPPLYEMVPLRGKVVIEDGQLVYKGTIPYSGCGAFRVVRKQ
jgi:hypothetical protein